MKTILLIIVIGILAIIFIPKYISKTNTALLQECPDEMIINKMPTIDDSNTKNSYYIKDGKRREISEYDAVWVNMNCKLKVQEVY